MKTIKRTVKVTANQLSEANEILKRTDFVEDAGRDELLYSFSVSFGNGIEADIKVYNGDGPFVDAILFHDGSEVFIMEPCVEQLDGEYIFEYLGHKYIVNIEQD